MVDGNGLVGNDMVPVKMNCFGRSETGPWRPSNQDSGFYDNQLAMVADGVGGAAAGDLASSLLVRQLARYLHQSPIEHENQFRNALANANQQLRRQIQANTDFSGMATTLSALAVLDDHAFIAHVGDSRIYRVRNNHVTQLTRDDSWVQMLLDHKLIDPDTAALHPMRNLLLHSMSGCVHDADLATIFPVKVFPGDRWLLASDGLTSYLPQAQLEQILTNRLSAEETVNGLMRRVWQHTKDNVTVIVADFVVDDQSLPVAPTYLGAAAEHMSATDKAG